MLKRSTAAAAIALVAIGTLTACSKSSSAPAPSSTPTSPSAATGDPKSEASPATGDTLTITTTEYAFEIPTITAGTHLMQLTNDGKQVHMAALVKLEDGKTAQDVLDYIEEVGISTPPSWVMDVGFGVAAPGKTIPMASSAQGPGGDPAAGIDFPAGNYVAVCFVREGMTTLEQRDDPKAQLHVAMGMIQEFTVA